jgi:O-antigen/teichoic acid export membrane protein
VIKKLLSSYAIYAIAPQLPKLVSLFMMPIITKYMTTEDYGIAGIILAYMAAFESLKDLGLRVTLTNSFFKYPQRFHWIWSRIYGFVQVWSVAFGVFLAGLLVLIIPDVAMHNYTVITLLIVIPLILFDPTLLIGRMFFQLSKKPMPIAVISVLASLITILVNYISIVIYHQGYLGLLYGGFASATFSMVAYTYCAFFIHKVLPNFNFDSKWVRSKLRVSLPTVPHYFAGYVINISDRILLDFFHVPLREIGMYSFAYSIGAYFSIIGKSFSKASGPFYMEFYKKENVRGENEAKRVSYIFQVFMLALAFFVSIWSKEIFDILASNDELKTTYLVAIIIFFSFTYYPSYSFNGMKLWYKEKTKLLMKISVTAAVISVVCNLILIPIYGYYGAAISTFISMQYMGYGGYLFKEIKNLFQVTYRWKTVLFVTAILLLGSLHLVETTIVVKSLVTLVVLLGIISFYFLEHIKSFFREIWA